MACAQRWSSDKEGETVASKPTHVGLTVEGEADGVSVGDRLGRRVGCAVGTTVGGADEEGLIVGVVEGEKDDFDGEVDGRGVGTTVVPLG